MVPFSSYAQFRLQGASDIGKLNWWLGIKTGLSLSQVNVLERYSVQSNTTTDNDDKIYSGRFKNLGQTTGLIFGYAFSSNLLLTFQPAYSNYKYTYKTSRTWLDYNGNIYALNTFQNCRIGYVEFPLLLLFRLPVGRFEPYINFGGFYGKFTGGRKSIKYNESITEAGLTQSEDQTETLELNKYMMRSQMGLMAGLGISYTIQYFRLGLEVSYKSGIYNITNVKERYSDTHSISKYFEVPDDVKLNALDITVNMFVPVDNLIHLHSSQQSRSGRK